MIDQLIKSPELASSIAALAGVFVAFIALVISVISLITSMKALKNQQRHNTLSVSPIPEITLADYEDSLRVKIRNNGTGPLIVVDFIVETPNGNYKDIVSAMGILPGERSWNDFIMEVKNQTILPGTSLPLLELTQFEGEDGFGECRDICRSWLRDIKCQLRYTDVYKSRFPTLTQDLDWFGRNLPQEHSYQTTSSET